jgi:hypothetical protein
MATMATRITTTMAARITTMTETWITAMTETTWMMMVMVLTTLTTQGDAFEVAAEAKAHKVSSA